MPHLILHKDEIAAISSYSENGIEVFSAQKVEKPFVYKSNSKANMNEL